MKTRANSNVIPGTLEPLMDIRGITTDKVKAICQQLGVRSWRELVTAVTLEQLEGIPLLTPENRKNIRRALKLDKDADHRMQLWDAILQGKEILQSIRQFPEVKRASFAGSLRRGKDTIGDIDIVVEVAGADRKKLLYKIDRMPLTDRIIAAGKSRICVLLHNQLLVYFYLADQQHYGATLLYYTGSDRYSLSLESLAAQKGYRFEPDGLYDIKNNEYVATENEEEVFRHLLLDYTPPELREDQELATATNPHKMPSLVTFDQVKGDMQIHTDWSDGEESIAHMAHYVFSVFPHYQYIVVTDHASNERTGHVLRPDDISRQAAEIKDINDAIGYDYVKRGVEVDILENGALSLPDELLKTFDWVIASVHSHFTKDNTARLLKACESPYVHCIGHPSGRLIGSRHPYPVDWDQVFAKAAATSTAMEINARPNRLDLNDILVKKAIANGVKLVIDTDAHSLAQFDFMQLGIWVARRAGCCHTDILNTFTWEEIEKFKKSKRNIIA
ncbi:DNA polymerase (family 10) [Chitinophaga polysaccharea]|uniref:DNA polymerase (Family 10) n=1 Tax=Chitinophaga polysaccharea TaxID=1293035 RepID=A0A561PW14_9BACT|nr:DNA polymerase/3'-5' exonuclease PolX [Chitinophaga polysaccharea]TWF42292.1 DNA polymerase (family 10) [Chitinophaga polysaccharea]